MSELVYHRILPISREEAEAALSSHDLQPIVDAPVNLAYYDPDWQWVQNKCLEYLDSDLPGARRISMICLGHLARIHGTLEIDKVVPLLEKMRSDPELGGTVEDTLEDINFFINLKR